MKILEIITPHETLDENPRTDAQELAKQAGTTIRNTANDVGERFNISWLRRAESQGVSNHIDQMLTKAGKDLKRSPDLADAERVLLDLEKTVKYDRAGKKQFEEIGDTLADALYAQKESRLWKNPIDELERMYRNSPNPPTWMSNTSIQLKRFDPEYLEWLTKSVNAKIVARREVDLAKPAPPPPKTKAEKEADKLADKEKKEADKLADKEKTVANKELDARELEADVTIATGKDTLKQIANDSKAAGAVGRWWNSLSTLDKGFFSAEAIRIIIINGQRLSDISEWRQSGNIPPEVAQYFPKVESPGTETVGGPGKQTVYNTNEQRVNAAANYATFTIIRQALLQLGGLGGGLLAGNALVKLGGGTINYASQIKILIIGLAPLGKGIVRIVEKIPSKFGGGTWITTSGSWISKLTVGGLKGISQAGKLMMIDYFISAVNPSQPFVSAPLTDLSNKLSTLSPYKNLQIDHPPDINDAVLSLLTLSTWSSIEGFSTSPFVKQMIGTYEASLVPIKIFLDTIGMILDVSGVDVPEIDVSVPPAGGKLPGEKNVPTEVKPVKPTPVVVPVPRENPEVTSTSPPAPADITTPVTTDNNGIKQRKLEETLKYKVLSRMKS
jgi:hypothetical protein